jgi:hypothetical protein
MHGVISYLSTRNPTNDEIARYRAGSLHSVELTDKAPQEPYSSKFAATEEAACSAKTVMAIRVTYPCGHDPITGAREAEEDGIYTWRAPAPVLTQRCVGVKTRIESQLPIELCDDEDLASKLVAKVNVESFDTNGNGLGKRPEDSLCSSSEEERQISALATKNMGPVVTKEILAQRWEIRLDTAHKTLATTTQYGVRRVLHPVERRHRTRQTHLRFPTLNTKLYTDTMFSATKSLRGHNCAQVFTNGVGYDLFYPLKKELDAVSTLNKVICTVGVPKEIVSDGA